MEIFEMFENIPRQGPGLNKSTKKAFSMLSDLPNKPKVLDIGCGTGAQTIQIAKCCDADIIAVDIHQPFLDELNDHAKSGGMSGKIITLKGSMFSLNFKDNSFDLIWSEGAIFIIGFERGLKEWSSLLKQNGYLVVTEITWLQPNVPYEPRKFWESEDLDIKTIDENLEIIKKYNYSLINYFVLPELGWWKDYYTPLEKRILILREKYKEDSKALSMMEKQLDEMELYRKYSDYYGYVFYLMKKK